MGGGRGGTEGGREEAGGAVGALADGNAEKKGAIREAGGIPVLVAMAREGTEGQKEPAAGALRNLAVGNAENKAAIAREGYAL